MKAQSRCDIAFHGILVFLLEIVLGNDKKFKNVIFGVQLVVFFCSSISVVLFHILRFSGCHNTFLLSPHHRPYRNNLKYWDR